MMDGEETCADVKGVNHVCMVATCIPEAVHSVVPRRALGQSELVRIEGSLRGRVSQDLA